MTKLQRKGPDLCTILERNKTFIGLCQPLTKHWFNLELLMALEDNFVLISIYILRSTDNIRKQQWNWALRPNARKQVYKARTGVKDFSYKRSLLQVRKLYPIGYTNLFWNLWPLRFIFPLLNEWFWVRFSNVCCFLIIMYVVLNITLMRDCNIGTRFTGGMTLLAVYVRKGNTHYLSGQTPQVDDDRDTIYIRKIIHN